MLLNRIVEYIFFFGLMAAVGYLMWLMFAPFVTALALAGVIVTICYPIYERIRRAVPRQNESLAAFLTTAVVVVIVILPLIWVASLIFNEALSIYRILGSGDYSIEERLYDIEDVVQSVVPGAELDLPEHLRQGVQWLAGKLGVIFVGTASTIFSFFIALIGSFFFFRDGKRFTGAIVKLSPLSDFDDKLILARMASAVRGVATGTLLVAILEGVMSATGFFIFGFERAVLLGTLVAIVALVPGIGASVIFIPAIAYSIFFGDYFAGIGLTVWFLVAVSLIDHLLGPYLMSRSHPMHPFLVLLSVLGGIVLFGPIGFIVGPVITSVFLVLLEIYAQNIAKDIKDA